MKSQIFNQAHVDKEIAALHREIDAKAKAEKTAETLRRQEISALGRKHDLMNEANAAICDDTSVDQFEARACIQKLEADKKALQALVADASRQPRRGALLSDPQDVRADKLLDAFNEAKRLNDPKARYEALKALQKNRENSE
jgi:hypothetical protein